MAVKELSDGGPDGARLGQSASDLIGFFGLSTCVSRRAAAAQATSALSTASSTAIDTVTKAFLIEVGATLTALGLWKGAA
jgi:hypothetical protein